MNDRMIQRWRQRSFKTTIVVNLLTFAINLMAVIFDMMAGRNPAIGLLLCVVPVVIIWWILGSEYRFRRGMDQLAIHQRMCELTVMQMEKAVADDSADGHELRH